MNLEKATNYTFLVSITPVEAASETNSYLGIIAMVLFIVLTVFVCVCMVCIIRVCMRKRRYELNIIN
ncbi:MAG: hypothetical protein ACMG6E_05790 [Candidatus Roizmanbacteria bacterium]